MTVQNKDDRWWRPGLGHVRSLNRGGFGDIASLVIQISHNRKRPGLEYLKTMSSQLDFFRLSSRTFHRLRWSFAKSFRPAMPQAVAWCDELVASHAVSRSSGATSMVARPWPDTESLSWTKEESERAVLDF